MENNNYIFILLKNFFKWHQISGILAKLHSVAQFWLFITEQEKWNIDEVGIQVIVIERYCKTVLVTFHLFTLHDGCNLSGYSKCVFPSKLSERGWIVGRSCSCTLVCRLRSCLLRLSFISVMLHEGSLRMWYVHS